MLFDLLLLVVFALCLTCSIGERCLGWCKTEIWVWVFTEVGVGVLGWVGLFFGVLLFGVGLDVLRA